MSIKFHLPDFAVNYKFNRTFVAMLQNCPEFFHDGLEIASFYGTFPQSLWNGGRAMTGICDKNYVKMVVRDFDRLRIPLRFTFTNPLITEEHLDDEFCNFVLRTADNGINGVIVVSPVLEEYIRTKYPNYKITSSTCKRITDIDKLNEETDKPYDIVVIDYDFNNRFDMLEKVQNKKKCEILVNACCMPKCPNRVDHYREIGAMQLAFCEHIKKNKGKPFTAEAYGLSERNTDCPCMEYDITDAKKHATHITPRAIFEKYIPMGFEQFKIEGRTMSIFDLTEYYVYYMVKPEMQERARIALYKNLQSHKVLTVN